MSRIHREPALFRRWWLLAWLGADLPSLAGRDDDLRHAARLPFTDYPFGIGSIFIIDPLFTLPVLVGAIVALCWRSPRACAGMPSGSR